MDLETFWRLVGEMRDRAETTDGVDDQVLTNCVVDVIAGRLTASELLAFDAVAGDLAGLADIPAMEAAMFLIEGYISDDSFMDFRDGLILLGRETFEAAIADPDSLAEHLQAAPVKGSADGSGGCIPIAFESITSCVADAWVRVTGTEDEDEFWDAARAFEQCLVVPARPPSGEPSILHAPMRPAHACHVSPRASRIGSSHERQRLCLLPRRQREGPSGRRSSIIRAAWQMVVRPPQRRG